MIQFLDHGHDDRIHELVVLGVTVHFGLAEPDRSDGPVSFANRCNRRILHPELHARLGFIGKSVDERLPNFGVLGNGRSAVEQLVGSLGELDLLEVRRDLDDDGLRRKRIPPLRNGHVLTTAVNLLHLQDAFAPFHGRVSDRGFGYIRSAGEREVLPETVAPHPRERIGNGLGLRELHYHLGPRDERRVLRLDHGHVEDRTDTPAFLHESDDLAVLRMVVLVRRTAHVHSADHRAVLHDPDDGKVLPIRKIRVLRKDIPIAVRVRNRERRTTNVRELGHLQLALEPLDVEVKFEGSDIVPDLLVHPVSREPGDLHLLVRPDRPVRRLPLQGKPVGVDDVVSTLGHVSRETTIGDLGLPGLELDRQVVGDQTVLVLAQEAVVLDRAGRQVLHLRDNGLPRHDGHEVVVAPATTAVRRNRPARKLLDLGRIGKHGLRDGERAHPLVSVLLRGELAVRLHRWRHGTVVTTAATGATDAEGDPTQDRQHETHRSLHGGTSLVVDVQVAPDADRLVLLASSNSFTCAQLIHAILAIEGPRSLRDLQLLVGQWTSGGRRRGRQTLAVHSTILHSRLKTLPTRRNGAL